MRKLTFSQRRRLFDLLWALVSNSALPFFLGFTFALISATHIVTDSFMSVDKAGFDFCVRKPDLGQGGN